MEPVENIFHVELNQGVNEDVKEHEQVPITVLSEEEEKSLSNEVRVHTKHKIQTQSKKKKCHEG